MIRLYEIIGAKTPVRGAAPDASLFLQTSLCKVIRMQSDRRSRLHRARHSHAGSLQIESS